MSSLADRLAARRVRLSKVYTLVTYAVAVFAPLSARIVEWRRDSRSRAELVRMTARDLRDIGITPDERDREINKWFWQQ